MPRPRVRPEDRQRSPRACEPCKTAKKRCDSAVPCAACVKKGIVASCVYKMSQRQSGRWRREHRSSVASSTGHTQDAIRSGDLGGTPGTARRASITPSHTESADDSTLPTVQSPLMLLSPSGENIFVGNTAALSFLQFLRTILKQYMGPSGFTEEQQDNHMVEGEVPDTTSAVFMDDLSEADANIFVQNFLEATSGLLDLFTEEELSQLRARADYARLANYQALSPTDRDDLASYYLIVAIGAQCQAADEREGQIAARYFTRARQLAFESMLQDPTVTMIRTFLLAAFYMLGASRRNSAFMYIGVASKAAGILGLHEPTQYRHLSAEEAQRRYRVGRSTRVLDSVCSSILGRPCDTPPLRPTNPPPTHLDDSARNHRSLVLGAAYESTAILQAIVKCSTDEEGLSDSSAEKYLQMLLEWSQALPPQLRRQPGGALPSQADHPSREAMVGNIHIACTYYFGVILATRQCLILHTIPQLQAKHLAPVGGSSKRAAQSGPSSEKIAELTKACTDAATYMAQMCWEASEGGVLLGNMCVLKAWLFAAGLILGFSLLLERGEASIVRNMFQATRRMLGTMGRLSPLAAQYYQILTSFHRAIKSYWEDITRCPPKPSAPYVVRILSPGLDGAASGQDAVIHSQYPTPGAAPGESTNPRGTPLAEDFDMGEHLDFETDMSFPEGFGQADASLEIIWSDVIGFMESFTPDFGPPAAVQP